MGCDKCGNECCRVVITKQGERGLQGPVGPPGRPGSYDMTALNVKTDVSALGWFKQKVVATLEFFSAVGSSSIDVVQDTDDIRFSIKDTAFVSHPVVDGDITSSLFTINSVFAKSFVYKDQHNKTSFISVAVEVLATYTGTTGEKKLDLNLANLPLNFTSIGVTQRYIGSLKFSIATPTELEVVEAFVGGSTIAFENSSFAFTNGNQYRMVVLLNTNAIRT